MKAATQLASVAARNFTAGPPEAQCGRSRAVFDFAGDCCTLATPLSGAARMLGHFHKTFGKSGQTKSQRSSMLRASRLGQSPFSCSFHFIMFALRPYFSMSLRTL
jgi:hypothetical protein